MKVDGVIPTKCSLTSSHCDLIVIVTAIILNNTTNHYPDHHHPPPHHYQWSTRPSPHLPAREGLCWRQPARALPTPPSMMHSKQALLPFSHDSNLQDIKMWKTRCFPLILEQLAWCSFLTVISHERNATSNRPA